MIAATGLATGLVRNRSSPFVVVRAVRVPGLAAASTSNVVEQSEMVRRIRDYPYIPSSTSIRRPYLVPGPAACDVGPRTGRWGSCRVGRASVYAALKRS